MNNISVIIIAKNEESNISETLESIKWADEIVVVDSKSNDRTRDVAKRFTDKVFVREFDDFSSQKNFAISKASCEWVLSIDADEVITELLADEIKHAVAENPDFDGYYINRINYMYGKRLNYYCQPDYKLRLFKRSKGIFVQPVHEYVECNGQTDVLKNSMLHFSIRNFKEHMQKARVYTTLEIQSEKSKNNLRILRCLVSLAIKPISRVFQSYILMKGFKEGLVGFVISINSGYVEFLKYIKCLKFILTGKKIKASSQWSDIYSKPADTEHYLDNVNIHSEFTNGILKQKPKTVLEVGCGSATLSVFLSRHGCSVISIDNDNTVLNLAKTSASRLKGKIAFREANAFNLPFKDKEFDVAFSQGLLEHFSDKEITLLLKEQLRVSKTVFFSVPNIFYNYRDFGNERLMTKKRWEKIIAAFDIKVSKNYYKIVAKRNFLIPLKVMYMAGVE